MKVNLKGETGNKKIVLIAEEDSEQESLTKWAENLDEHVFLLKKQKGESLLFLDLGSQSEACNVPINILSSSKNSHIQLISNFAHTPFELHSQSYASVEAFWQCLKFPENEERKKIALFFGKEARQAGQKGSKGESFVYDGKTIKVASRAHWKLMYQACYAKFTQNPQAQKALLQTGSRPLMHKTRRDSPAIPGVIMADIWMKIRHHLQQISN